MRLTDTDIIKKRDENITTYIDNGNFGKTCIATVTMYIRDGDRMKTENYIVHVLCGKTPDEMSNELRIIFLFYENSRGNGIDAVWGMINSYSKMESYIKKHVFKNFYEHNDVDMFITKMCFSDSNNVI